jgi:hypothetical protein
VKQPLRRFDEEKCRAIGDEIHKLMATGFIKEVFHPEWLANPVLVKKKGGKWRMCVDYTGLNKACPKVPYPLPRIDQIVDSTAGCETLSFLDAYSGYHQIKMKESDQLATSFITPFGMYCYITMPFSLRNAGVTYQRCMNHVFGEHIGRTVEAYVDDIVVKTKKASDLLSSLETTFKCLRAKGVKLNPEKCVFRVPRGMLLGFIVSERGIEANLDVFSRDIHQPSVKTDDTPEPEEASAQPEVSSAAEGEALRVEGERNGVTPNRNWQTPYLQYLHRGELPLDKAEARRLAWRAKSFVLLGNEKELYHRSPSGILQRCISVAEGQELLQEIHSGACGHHAAPRALIGNAFRQGFYWPTAVADATRIVLSCQGCQFYARQTHLPAQALQTLPITWPFVVWGLDLVGPLQKAPGGFSHLLVAIDKFSKWIEVRPLTSIRSEQAVAFFTNIIHRFGVSNSIITDNGTQFTGKKFLDFCEDHHIRVDWATVAHPMMNGQVERANCMLLHGLKPRIYNDLNKFGKQWMKELPSVFWSLRTMPSRATSFSPLFLVYGAEAILPTDLEYGSPRTRAYDDQSN